MNEEFNLEEAKSLDIELLSFEKLDRSSPELWPQLVPGLSEFANLIKTPNNASQINKPGTLNPQISVTSANGSTTGANTAKWMSDLDRDDIETLNNLANFTPPQLMEKVKELIELAYQLGLEESYQMTRGRLLNILDKENN